MSVSALLLGAAAWATGVTVAAPIAGYVLAPRVLRKRATTPAAASLQPTNPEDLDENNNYLSDDSAADEATEAAAPLTLVRPNDPGLMRSESDRLRLSPVHSLKRKRRSRKIRRAEIKEEKLMPLVPGARTSVDESIIAAYVGDDLEQKQEAGEDYWIDPSLLAAQVEAKRQAETRRKRSLRKPDAYKADKLRSEIAAPYKTNWIGVTVVIVGAAAALFALFPSLLETPTQIEPKFPLDL